MTPREWFWLGYLAFVAALLIVGAFGCWWVGKR